MKLIQSWLVLLRDVKCDGIPGSIKVTLSHHFPAFALQQAKRSVSKIVCLIWCCLSLIYRYIMASEQFKRCVHPCPRYITGGHTCFKLFGSAACTGSSRGSCLCSLWSTSHYSAALSAGVLWRARSGSRFPWFRPASVEAAWRLRLWGSWEFMGPRRGFFCPRSGPDTRALCFRESRLAQTLS